MALGVSSLLLSVSSIKRLFGDAAVTPGDGTLDYLLTQSGQTLQAQDGRFILVEQSLGDTTEIVQLFDPITTQAGDFIGINQNPNQILVLDQDFEQSGRTLLTEAGENLVNQDGEALLTQREA